MKNILCLFLSDDFKPASVDTSQPGNLEVGAGGEVTVSLPNIQVILCKYLVGFFYGSTRHVIYSTVLLQMRSSLLIKSFSVFSSYDKA